MKAFRLARAGELVPVASSSVLLESVRRDKKQEDPMGGVSVHRGSQTVGSGKGVRGGVKGSRHLLVLQQRLFS